MSEKIQKEGQNTEQNVIMTLQKQDVVSGCGWDRTTLSSCWLSEAIKIHSMSSGPLSSGARVNRQSSFTLWPLAFSTNVCPVDVMSRPEAKPSRHGHRREGLGHTGVNWTDDQHIRGKKTTVLVGWKPLKHLLSPKMFFGPTLHYYGLLISFLDNVKCKVTIA